VGVYSNTQIKKAITDGHIVFHPYVEEHVAGSSVDVTLGKWFYRTERPSQGGFYNPFDESAVGLYFDGPYKAEIHEEWGKQLLHSQSQIEKSTMNLTLPGCII
jgi:deoxycytidine triphosphate deaminase